MGKKSVKSKERKQKREDETRKTNLHWKKVEKANQELDPLSSFVSFQNYSNNNLKLKLRCLKRTDLSNELFQWAFDLTKQNMQLVYESTWGWNDKSKRKELDDDRMWFLLANDEQGTPVAFSSFRFDIDFDKPVVYCYEIQLANEVQGKGLGKFMMKILQLFAIKYHMQKVVATVLYKNERSLNFFKDKLGYVVDSSSPFDECYCILSKAIPRKNIETEE